MSLDHNLNKILIVDFGSQFTQLIARRIRELGIFCEIISHKKVKNKNIDSLVKGIILSGGPLNVYEIKRYSFDKKIIQKGIPILGICFGHQIIAQALGGRVEKFDGGWSVGLTDYEIDGHTYSLNAWHQDQVVTLPTDAQVIGQSDFCANAVLSYGDHILTFQPHPEFDAAFTKGLIDHRGQGVVPDDLLNSAKSRLQELAAQPEMAERIARHFQQEKRT